MRTQRKKACVCVNVTKSMQVQPLFTCEGVCFNYRVNVCMKQLSSQLEKRQSPLLSLTVSLSFFLSFILSVFLSSLSSHSRLLHPLRMAWVLYRGSEHCFRCYSSLSLSSLLRAMIRSSTCNTKCTGEDECISASVLPVTYGWEREAERCNKITPTVWTAWSLECKFRQLSKSACFSTFSHSHREEDVD